MNPSVEPRPVSGSAAGTLRRWLVTGAAVVGSFAAGWTASRVSGPGGRPAAGGANVAAVAIPSTDGEKAARRPRRSGGSVLPGEPAAKPVPEKASFAGKLAALRARPDPDGRQAALRRLGREQANIDLEGALKQAALVTDASDRLEYLRGVVGAWAAHDPAAALRYAMGVDGLGTRVRLASAALETWAQSEPAQAAAWAESSLVGEARVQAVAAVRGNLGADRSGRRRRLDRPDSRHLAP